jgi:3D (Asp-Asp-Asp) domain-containing protein
MTQLLTQANTPHEMPVVLAPEAEPIAEVVEEVPEWHTFEVTAYTSREESTGKHPGDDGYGITASGEPVSEGITAACPPSLPFGQRIEIEGVGERICTDRGGAINEGRLDIYIAELKEARQFGRQRLDVRIIE